MHALAALMDRNFDLRRCMFGDTALGARNLRMVELARSHGAAAKFPGSGGAVLVLCPKVCQLHWDVWVARGLLLCLDETGRWGRQECG